MCQCAGIVQRKYLCLLDALPDYSLSEVIWVIVLLENLLLCMHCAGGLYVLWKNITLMISVFS